jgi:PAS domain S-box-containing protein
VRLLRAAARVCAAGAVLLAILALIGWLTNWRRLASIGPNFIPMAPNTAIGLIFTSATVLLLSRGRSRDIRAEVACAGIIGILALLRLGEYVLGVDVGVDRWVFRIPVESLGLAPVGKMALFTALCFLSLTGAIMCIALQEWHYALEAVGRVLASVVGFVGLMFALGYAYGKPLLYGNQAIPMALNTAIGFFLLGLGLSLVGIARDVTERLLAAAALRESEQRHRVVVEQAADGITLVDAQTLSILEVNHAFARLLGYGPAELIGKPIAELIADTPEGVAARARQTLGSGAPTGLQRQYRRKDGSIVDVEKSATVIEQDGRKVLCTVVHDVTERNRAEAALAAEKNLLRTVIDNLPDRVYVKDCQGRYMLDNVAHQKQIGVSSAEAVIGKTGYDLFPRDVAARFEQDDQAILRSATPLYDREELAVDRKGQKRWLLTTKVPFTDGNGSIVGIVGLSRDITELKNAQTQLVQAEKLAGLGQMVAGVAHEINNPLSFVANNVAVLQRDLGPLRDLLEMYRRRHPLLTQQAPQAMHEINELIERIDLEYTLNNLGDLFQRSREGLRRIQQIVKDLRDFARLDEGDLHDADLNAGIQSTANIILGRAKKKQVQIDLQLGQLPLVSCYPAKINQVVMNLLANAIDASKEGEKVIVATRASNGEVQIDVIDTGCGIPPEVREKIFDPFFTTKPQGEGTGLGLSISYGIIQDHGGRIEVDSTVGQGTKFTVHVPIKK